MKGRCLLTGKARLIFQIILKPDKVGETELILATFMRCYAPVNSLWDILTRTRLVYYTPAKTAGENSSDIP